MYMRHLGLTNQKTYYGIDIIHTVGWKIIFCTVVTNIETAGLTRVERVGGGS